MTQEQAQVSKSGWRERALSLRALGFFLFLDIVLGIAGFPRAQKLLLEGRSRKAGDWSRETGHEHARRILRAVQNATRFYYRRRKDCLPKALTIYYLLRRKRIPADLCYGVKKFPFGAHSWVEAYGEVLDDDPETARRYVVIHRVATVG